MNNYLNVFKNFTDFEGRMSRKEYWMFQLYNFGIYILFTIVDSLIFYKSPQLENYWFLKEEGIFSFIYGILVIVPGLSAGVRRMHDINRSGWWIIAPIVNIIFSLQKGDDNKNEYGEPTNYQN